MKKILITTAYLFIFITLYGYESPIKLTKAENDQPYKPFTYEIMPLDKTIESIFITTDHDCFSLFTSFSIPESGGYPYPDLQILEVYRLNEITRQDMGTPAFSETGFSPFQKPLFYRIGSYIYIPRWNKLFELIF